MNRNFNRKTCSKQGKKKKVKEFYVLRMGRTLNGTHFKDNNPLGTQKRRKTIFKINQSINLPILRAYLAQWLTHKGSMSKFKLIVDFYIQQLCRRKNNLLIYSESFICYCCTVLILLPTEVKWAFLIVCCPSTVSIFFYICILFYRASRAI